MTSDAPTPMTARNPISTCGSETHMAAAEAPPKIASPINSARRRPNRSPSAPAGSSRAANASEYASMIHDSSVCEACVDFAMSGIATFSEDIAATTAASARQTTAVIGP